MPVPEQAPRDRQTPAWIVSTLVHASLLVLAVLFVNVAPRGAADEPGRQVGVVLKRATPDATLYEGPEATDAAAETSDALPASDALDTLPDTTDDSGFDELLPQPLGLGPAESGDSGANATQMTAGGAGDRPAIAGGTRTSVFGVQGEGRRFVYVFDRSFSMDGPPLAAAKRQLIKSLESLESTHQFQIVFFNFRTLSPDLTGGQNRIAFADERNKQLAANWIEGVAADGGTNRPAALAKALAMSPDVVFFLTDADNAMTTAELELIARRNRRIGATICTIEFGIGPSRGQNNFLVQLASMTGGQYGYIDTTRLGR